MAKGTSLREWKRAVKQTLGIDLFDDYYKGEFYEEALRKWIDDNILKIKTIPTQTLGSMREIILKGFSNGETIRTITQAIQDEYNISKSRAQMLARDQLSTLNSQITQLQQKDAGCNKYKWSTSKDSRVRDCHRSFHGKVFSWDEPPEIWYVTKKSGKIYTGRRCHPGEDYCCRCVAIPVFDLETIDVPIKSQDDKGGANGNY
jgi:SPP1 gp7 family putative phage head morphogenesis protein